MIVSTITTIFFYQVFIKAFQVFFINESNEKTECLEQSYLAEVV